MGIHLTSVFTTTIINSAIPAADTIIMTTPALSPGLDNAGILLWWYLQLSTGAGGTSLTFKLSRGTAVAGSPLLSFVVTGVATTNQIIPGCFVDTPGVVAGQQYTISINDSGAAGVANFGCMMAAVL